MIILIFVIIWIKIKFKKNKKQISSTSTLGSNLNLNSTTAFNDSAKKDLFDKSETKPIQENDYKITISNPKLSSEINMFKENKNSSNTIKKPNDYSISILNFNILKSSIQEIKIDYKE